jgi:hypothetical protein
LGQPRHVRSSQDRTNKHTSGDRSLCGRGSSVLCLLGVCTLLGLLGLLDVLSLVTFPDVELELPGSSSGGAVLVGGGGCLGGSALLRGRDEAGLVDLLAVERLDDLALLVLGLDARKGKAAALPLVAPESPDGDGKALVRQVVAREDRG